MYLTLLIIQNCKIHSTTHWVSPRKLLSLWYWVKILLGTLLWVSVCRLFWLPWVMVAVQALSNCGVGFSLWWLLLLWNLGSRRAWVSGVAAGRLKLCCTGLVVLWHVGSSHTRDQTRDQMSRALASRSLTTGPPQKLHNFFLTRIMYLCISR